jgi:hypothetical protein
MNGQKLGNTRAILDAALAALRQNGIQAEAEREQPLIGPNRADAMIRVNHGGQEILYAAVVKRGLRPALLGAVLHQLEALGQQALIVADYVTPPLADALRQHHLAFIDIAGNAYLERPPLLVWIKGQQRRYVGVAPHHGRAFTARGLQVTFALLCHKEQADFQYREIAKIAGVALGTVALVMAELVELGFVAELAGKRRLLQPQLLLDRWVEAYIRTLRPKLLLGRFRAEKLEWWKTMDPLKYGLALGGEGAAARLTHHLRPGTLTFFGDQVDPHFLLDYQLRSDPRGEVEVLRRFWNFENRGAPALVPTLLVYADLLATGDARCLETAKRIYDGILTQPGK